MENDFKYGNFTREDVTRFPIDCETMETLQNNTRLMSVIARIAGAEYEGTHLLILSGCKKNGTRRTAGYVYISGPETADGGEILYHPEQPDAATCFIQDIHDDVAANGQTFSQAYTTRRLTSGNGPNAHAWKNFTDIASISNAELSERIEQRYEALNKECNGLSDTIAQKYKELKDSVSSNKTSLENSINSQLVKGMIIMWSGLKSNIPKGWALCDGNNQTPDLRGRFVVGYSDNKLVDGKNYNVGDTGGEAAHQLTQDEMPMHSHYVDDYYIAKAASAGQNTLAGLSGQSVVSSADKAHFCNDTSTSTSLSLGYFIHHSQSAGLSKSHENRPPYYALCFIMKL